MKTRSGVQSHGDKNGSWKNFVQITKAELGVILCLGEAKKTGQKTRGRIVILKKATFLASFDDYDQQNRNSMVSKMVVIKCY